MLWEVPNSLALTLSPLGILSFKVIVAVVMVASLPCVGFGGGGGGGSSEESVSYSLSYSL